jgi:hypothetical protein
MRLRRTTERGSASLEAVFAVGFLLIPVAALLAQAPGWVDTSHTAQSAANEAARAAVLTDDIAAAGSIAEATAAAVVANHGHDATDLLAVNLDGTFSRGATLTVTVQLQGHQIVVPGLGTIGPAYTATGSATERVDDYRGFGP